jgi:hypothetical protein
MSNIREVRLAIAEKLKERRRFMDEASQQRHRADRSEQAHRDTLSIVKSSVFSYEIEACADEIIKSILDEAIEASEIVAQESMDPSQEMYEIGIDIPSLHIRRLLYKPDLALMARESRPFNDIPVKRINVDLRNRGF